MKPVAPFTEEERAALERCLRECIAAGTPLTYLTLAERLAMAGPHRIHRLTAALEDLVRADHAAGRPLLAACAVGRSGLPGRGFFQLLRELGRYDGPDGGTEAAACHARELAAALDWWRGPEGDAGNGRPD